MYAERLKEIRKNLRYTADEMADLLGVKVRTYGSYERNEAIPSIQLGTLLCNKLNINLNWFCTGKGEIFNPPQFEQVKDDLAQRMDKFEKALRSAGILKD